MRTYTYALAGEECSVYYCEDGQDALAFATWLSHTRAPIALDTETTGLGIYEPGFATRLVQFGTRTEAYVLRADQFREVITNALNLPRYRFILHNAAYDAQVLDRCGFVDLDDLLSRTFDTRLLAHLLDPRGKQDGGTGHGLKDLSSVFVDATAPDTSAGLYEVFRREYSATKSTGWALIDIDHPTYVLYAGLDVLLTARLFDVVGPLVKERGFTRLATFEHLVQAAVCRMMRRGVRLDVAYTERLAEDLADVAAAAAGRASIYGIDNVNSTKQIAAALLGMGETLADKTPSGAWKVDKTVLGLLTVRGNPLAAAVTESKRASKWRETYALGMLHGRDADDRVHCDISSLQARTARMSISRPPLQQLPSQDWTIRRCLVADEGQVIGGVDFKAVEMRVLAALADVKAMRRAIAAGEDLHAYTADLMYGPGNWQPSQRTLVKIAGFLKVYGGGADAMVRQTGVTLDAAKRVIAQYDGVYPEIKRYGRRLQDRAQFGAREVETPSGRVLPLDRDRLYSATNYVVQSTARDLFAQALLDLEEAGLGEYLLLPVHDEVIFQAPALEAADVSKAIAEAMGSDFFGVPIDADPEVYGASWGHGHDYGMPDEFRDES